MATHKLILEDDFDEEIGTLIAIHCTIEDYRLAYYINKNLGISLIRKLGDIDFNGNLKYSIFEWNDEKQFTTWNLVSNMCKIESDQQSESGSLFNSEEKVIKTINLIPEHKQVNFFLKIDNKFDFQKEKKVIESILNIPQVTIAYSIDANKLKSKDNLIFN